MCFLSADAIANSTSGGTSTSISSGNHLELVATAAVDELSGVTKPRDVALTLRGWGVGIGWVVRQHFHLNLRKYISYR